MNLPNDFIQKINSLLGSDSQAFFEALERLAQKGITLNNSRMRKDCFVANFDEEIEEIPMVDNGYYVGNFKFAENLFNHLGVIYSQEPSAMYPIELLDIQPNDRVLDVCASPGGKSIQILEKLNGTGILIANEIVYKRAKILQENITRMGFDNCIITCNSPEDFEETNLVFDKIIIDAPCGGEGMIRKSSFDINNYSPNTIETNAKRQLNILNSISPLLKNGGTLVYSTCTYDIRENEGVIVEFLKSHKDYEIIDKSEYFNIAERGIKIDNFDTNLALRRYPHKCRGEGQFMIALKRKCENEEYFADKKSFRFKSYIPISNKDKLLINDTFKNVFDIKHMDFVKKDNFIYTEPKVKIDTKSLNVIHLGVCVGEIQKNIFKISHDFYHAYGSQFYHKIDLNKNDAIRYIRGEELDIDMPNNIYSINYLSTPLGGGKIANGKLKNYYSKNYRIN